MIWICLDCGHKAENPVIINTCSHCEQKNKKKREKNKNEKQITYDHLVRGQRSC